MYQLQMDQIFGHCVAKVYLIHSKRTVLPLINSKARNLLITRLFKCYFFQINIHISVFQTCKRVFSTFCRKSLIHNKNSYWNKDFISIYKSNFLSTLGKGVRGSLVLSVVNLLFIIKTHIEIKFSFPYINQTFWVL